MIKVEKQQQQQQQQQPNQLLPLQLQPPQLQPPQLPPPRPPPLLVDGVESATRPSPLATSPRTTGRRPTIPTSTRRTSTVTSPSRCPPPWARVLPPSPWTERPPRSTRPSAAQATPLRPTTGPSCAATWLDSPSLRWRSRCRRRSSTTSPPPAATAAPRRASGSRWKVWISFWANKKSAIQ